jgi:hypothetical protein
MSKIDITIGRTITINTGNYQSTKPTVEFTLKDVDVKDVEIMAASISSIVEDLLKIETVKASGQIKELEKEGYMGYCRTILETVDDIEKSIEYNLGVINQQ